MATDRRNDLHAFKLFIETQPENERASSVKAIREALEDMHAGDTGIPADAFLAKAHRKYSVPERP